MLHLVAPTGFRVVSTILSIIPGFLPLPQTPGGNSLRVEQLLNFLLRGTADTIDQLIYSLRETGQSHSEVTRAYLREPKKPDRRLGEFASRHILDYYFKRARFV